MSRPPFTLTDEQARSLMAATNRLAEMFPIDRHDHRPFVASFIRAVYDATGRTFSPSIYRRLLSAYTCGRSPSTNTLELERKLFEQELARDSLAAAAPTPSIGRPSTVEDVAAAIRRVMAEYVPLFAEQAAARAPEQQEAHFAYLIGRLAESEEANASTRATAARLASQLQEAVGAAAIHQEQVSNAQAALAAQTAALTNMASELAEMRKFTLMSIENARSETREAKELCKQLRAELVTRDNELDALRRSGYRQAAPPLNPPATSR